MRGYTSNYNFLICSVVNEQVQPGDEVKVGDKIGDVGRGEYVHMEVYDSGGKHYDPCDYLNLATCSLVCRPYKLDIPGFGQ